MATTPVDNLAINDMVVCMQYEGVFGNAASEHAYGYQAKEKINDSKTILAQVLNADPNGIVWTSGATESINLALKGAANFYHRKGKHIVTLATEHKAVLDVCKELSKLDFDITYLKPDEQGLVKESDLKAALRKDTVLVSLAWVNNEIGVIQDLSTLANIVKTNGSLLHVDAAQALGKIKMDVAEIPIDLLSLSAHKAYGPKGVGALYVRQSPKVRLMSQIHGGGQQFNLRSGTLPVSQIVGFAQAARLADEQLVQENSRIKALRDQLWQGLQQLKGVHLNGSLDQRVAHNLNVRFDHVDGEALLVGLKDIAVSRGSACTAATMEPSHVLLALGLTRLQADQSIRFSLGRYTTKEDIDFTINHVIDTVNWLRSIF